MVRWQLENLPRGIGIRLAREWALSGRAEMRERGGGLEGVCECVTV